MSEPYSASRGGFERVEPLGEGFIRGPARLLIAPFSYKFPTEINSIINLEKEANYKTEKQKISKLIEPSVGSFYLGFGGYATPKLEWTVKISEIVEALEGLPLSVRGILKLTQLQLKNFLKKNLNLNLLENLK